jgi:hypothetical protein
VIGHIPIEQRIKTRQTRFVRRILMRYSVWLGDRDSNPNYLIQSQAFYR